MSGPLEGLKVIELGWWVAAPAAAGLLADWGAEVIKVEPPNGDPMRAIFKQSFTSKKLESLNPPFDGDNRGKRSMALDVGKDEGRGILLSLLGDADVFITNLRPRALEKLRLRYEDLAGDHPRLVYCHITGYGDRAGNRDRPSYDAGAFWAASGIARWLAPPEAAEIPTQPAALGDHVSAQAAVSAICAAVFARSRTGAGQKVSVSLLRSALHTVSWDANLALRGVRVAPRSRTNPLNPLMNSFRAGDGRWFWLLFLQPDRGWTALCYAIGRSELLEDGRFGHIVARRKNATELVAILDDAFQQRPLTEWAAIFEQHDVWWAPVHDINDTVHDDVTRASGAVVRAEGPDGPVEMISGPADFSATPWSIGSRPPELGEHTEEILLETGRDWDEIVRLKDAAVIL